MSNNSTLKIIILFFVFLHPQKLYSLSEAENMRKYWDYRDKLKKYFLKIGPDAGESLPMENRCDNCIIAGNSKIRFGDGTIQLGYYISVLASEFKLLTDAQLFNEAAKTKNELYYAIRVAGRLDYSAESYLGGPALPGNTNDFLIRDDVGNNFKDNWDNTVNGIYETPWYEKDKVDYLTSDWYNQDGGSAGNNYFNDHNEMSQDQIISLLMGFAFVKKFVDNNWVQPENKC